MNSDGRNYKTRLTCLVCEDDGLIRMNTVEMLEELGHAAFEAKDAASALSLFAHQDIDVLLTDISLPDLSGILLAQRIRESHPKLPVIFATGYGHVDALSGPGFAYLAKPFTIEALATTIEGLTLAT